ncbi:T9SS type A sorting domain-containing protein, partial [Bacteroidales bacterium OttesenSCG-928-M06]|nr:T9SS type A sorting domain-containing protein [Bacteroidales bacterium OttesenSCG-928-M06]
TSLPTLNNVTISKNTANLGGGMYNNASSPTLNNVTINKNTAKSNGGGMYNNETSSPTLNNVIISENTANLGGGMYNNASSPTLNNVTINKNTAKSNGGGMCNYTSSPTLNNVTISKNTAKSNGGGMYNNYSTPKNYNCIIWGNGSTNISNYNGTSTYKYSIVEGVALSGDGNLNGKNPANAPLFMDAENGNFRLKKGSPGIDAGSNDLFDTEAYGDKDLGGNSRILGKAIDMGAYESIPDSKWIGTSAEWNNSDNWSYGIPTGEIDVILPSGAAIYPSITESDQATTNSITFAYGAELGNQHLLNYNKAFVEFDFNIDKLDRDRYYFISAPLLEMVSGDFFFGGKPEVWVRYAQALEVTGGDEMTTTISELSLTKNLANYAVDLNPGFGFAYRVDSDTRSTQKNLEAKDNKLVLPRFEYEKDGNNADSPFGYSAEDYGYNQHEAWDSQNNTSHFYYFYKGEPDERAPEDKYQDTKVRSKNAKGIYKANRFMTEAIHGSLNIAIGTQGKDALMGNPFLSHIDFVKFFTANSSVIEPYFKVYNGTAVEHCYYNTEDDKVYTTATEGNDILSDGLIAPMQAFFIKPKDESATSVSLSITPEMTTTNNGFSLKSSNEEQGEVLSVTLNCNEFSSSVVLLRNTEANGAGVPKLFSNLTLPEIFINQERVAKAIAEIDKQTQSVSLGIRKGTGNASLTFSGMEHFTDTEISLYDNLSEKTYPLTAEMNTYNFEAEGDAENRFYLLFKDSNTGMEEMKASQISVYGKDRSLIISSDPTNRIEAIKVLSVQGIVVKHYSNLSAVTYQTPDTFSEGVYVVEVNTEKRKEVKKVIIK